MNQDAANPSTRLQSRRERLPLTQEQVAQRLGVAREMISLWETGHRLPSSKQLASLASLYGVSEAYLLGDEGLSAEGEHDAILRGLPESGAVTQAVGRWLCFLDKWARFIHEDLGRERFGPGSPPKRLGKGQLVTDVRRAPTLAEEVRAFYGLGKDALPDLYTFFDEHDILVYKAALGRIDEDGSISGAFYNHAEIGYCVLLNTDTAPGRQVFTLAHEWGHALYHHTRGGIVCRFEKDPLERFADAFAANLLVSGKELRRLAGKKIDRFEALKLAQYFGVSYAMLLVRLRQERLISEEVYLRWRGFSPRAMASQIGLNPRDFSLPERAELELSRYPVSVLETVDRAIRKKRLSLTSAAHLLDVEMTSIEKVLLSPPIRAAQDELLEYAELPF